MGHTLHRWFDHWLYGVNNGIENEPKVTIEDEMDTWGDYAEWPVPGTQNVDLYLRAAGNRAAPARSASRDRRRDGLAQLHGRTTRREANLMNNPTGSQANRRVFMSHPLTRDVRISGTPTADLVAQFGQVAGLPAGRTAR